MKKLLYASIAIISLIIMACPYEGDVKLNMYEDSLKSDKKLEGEWVAFHGDGGREELVIEKSARSIQSVSHKQFGGKNKLEGNFQYRIFSTDIGGYTLFNIENSDGKYLYAKYAWTGKNEFYIQFIEGEYISENFKADSVTTENFRAFVTENVNSEKLFGEKLEFYRKYSPEYEKVKMFMRKSGF